MHRAWGISLIFLGDRQVCTASDVSQAQIALQTVAMHMHAQAWVKHDLLRKYERCGVPHHGHKVSDAHNQRWPVPYGLPKPPGAGRSGIKLVGYS